MADKEEISRKGRGPQQPNMEAMDKCYKNTRKDCPKWSLGYKPEMIIGGVVPSWVKSIPGPKYMIETDKYKKRAPSWGFRPLKDSDKEKKKEMSKSASDPGIKGPTIEQMDKGWAATLGNKPPTYTLGTKPKMIIGDSVPSWVASIPGPKYNPDPDYYKKKPPVYTIGKKLDMVIGGEIPSWTRSIPGPKYHCDTDKFKKKQPVYTIGEKLPTEGEIMATRSPGPVYGGATTDAQKQSLVDSTKKRTCAPGFGIGPRFSGLTYEMILSGAHGRHERGHYAY